MTFFCCSPGAAAPGAGCCCPAGAACACAATLAAASNNTIRDFFILLLLKNYAESATLLIDSRSVKHPNRVRSSHDFLHFRTNRTDYRGQPRHWRGHCHETRRDGFENRDPGPGSQGPTDDRRTDYRQRWCLPCEGL